LKNPCSGETLQLIVASASVTRKIKFNDIDTTAVAGVRTVVVAHDHRQGAAAVASHVDGKLAADVVGVGVVPVRRVQRQPEEEESSPL
jgi:hypothetical protein